MNQPHTLTLPSISNLLINDLPPKLNLSPPSPIIAPNTPPYLDHPNKSPTFYRSITPVLSPIHSPLLNEQNLPPIHGDDPPQRLRLPSTLLSPVSPKTLFNDMPPSPKRKREEEDQIVTFLTPTVLDIPVSKDQKEREIKANQKILTNQQQLFDDMNDSMTAFTSSDMDTILHMPRKKRGRKPKTLIHGNSCFVWKDLTSTRSK